MWLVSARNIVAFHVAYRRTVIPVSLLSLMPMSRYSVTPGSAVGNLAGSEVLPGEQDQRAMQRGREWQPNGVTGGREAGVDVETCSTPWMCR